MKKKKAERLSPDLNNIFRPLLPKIMMAQESKDQMKSRDSYLATGRKPKLLCAFHKDEAWKYAKVFCEATGRQATGGKGHGGVGAVEEVQDGCNTPRCVVSENRCLHEDVGIDKAGISSSSNIKARKPGSSPVISERAGQSRVHMLPTCSDKCNEGDNHGNKMRSHL